MCEINPFQFVLQGLGLIVLVVLLGAIFLITVGGPDLDKVFPDDDKKGGKK